MPAIVSNESSYQQRNPASPLPEKATGVGILTSALPNPRIRFCRRGYLAALAKTEVIAEAPAEEALAAAGADAEADADVAEDADFAAGDSVSPEADGMPAPSLDALSTRWGCLLMNASRRQAFVRPCFHEAVRLCVFMPRYWSQPCGSALGGSTALAVLFPWTWPAQIQQHPSEDYQPC
jgi:hypothetical protein